MGYIFLADKNVCPTILPFPRIHSAVGSYSKSLPSARLPSFWSNFMSMLLLSDVVLPSPNR